MSKRYPHQLVVRMPADLMADRDDDGRVIYTCAVCGRNDVWRRGRQWWPLLPAAHRMADPEPAIIVCSDACKAQTRFATAGGY